MTPKILLYSRPTLGRRMSKKIVIASPYRYRKPRKFYCSGTQQNAVLTPPPPSHSPNRNMRSVGEHLLSDPMVMGSNPALGTPSWSEIQFHESTDVMRGKLGCQVAGVKTTAWQLFCGITLP